MNHPAKPSANERRFTLYGRNTVIEILSDNQLLIHRVHLAQSNRPGDSILQIRALCESRGIPVLQHTKQALSRISKNSRQDQGVAIDIVAPKHTLLDDYVLEAHHHNEEFFLLEGITNPQNLGMIIRSVAASPMTGIILPTQGCAKLDPLVYKASAGCLLKTQILKSSTTKHALEVLRKAKFQIIGLDGSAIQTVSEVQKRSKTVFLLGNESAGLSDEALNACDQVIHIPMRNDVESLNVAVTAGIIAFKDLS